MAKTTVTTLKKMKQAGDKITVLTAYDYSFANVIEAQGIDIILVGDSLGMVIQGHDSTIPVTVDDIVYHTKAVARACNNTLLIADLPFMSYTSPAQATNNATRLMQEGGAQMVKLEGGAPQVETVSQLSHHGVPVCAHLGLQPQSVHKIGGYHVQGRAEEHAKIMLDDAIALQNAGADAIVLECIPVALGKKISQALDIPTIGIGAGRDCDGQVLVLQDMLGISSYAPKFVQNFLQDGRTIAEAIAAFRDAVKNGHFPTDEQCFF